MRKVLFILGYLDDTDIQWIQTNGRRRDLDADTVLIAARQPIDSIYILLSGELSIIADEEEVARRFPGEIIGELSFLDSRSPTESVLAATPVSVIAIDRARLRDRLASDTPFAARFYQSLGVLLASRFRQTMGQLVLRDNVNSLDEDDEADDELDPDLLDHVAIAATRFDMLNRHFLT